LSGRLRIERSRTAACVIHREHIDTVFANHVEDAIREALERRSLHSVVHHGMGFGLARDPGEARLDGEQEGLAQAALVQLVPAVA
jgi:hypothetical protein